MAYARWSVVFVVGVVALAAPCSSEELSLDLAMSVALEDNPMLEAASAQVDAAQQGERAASAAWMPSLSASGSFGSYDGDVLFGRFMPGAPGGGATEVGPYDTNFIAALELEQLLYDGGAISSSRRTSEVERRVAEEELRRGRLDVAFEVTRTFFAVLLAERRIEVADRGVARSDEGLEVVRLRLTEREALQVELLGAESQLAADRLALLDAGNQLALARQALNRLLGRELEANMDLAGSLEDRRPVVAESEGVLRATAESTAVQLARLGLERADATVGSASALRRPKLDLRAVYMRVDNDLIFDGDYVGAVVNLSIPFLRDWRSSSAALGQARALRRQAEALQRDMESNAKLEAQSAYRQLNQAYASIDVAERNLAYHQERHRVSLSAYREQLVTYGEVLEQHSELSRAEFALSEAHFGARIAEAEVRRIVGDYSEGSSR
jgi:outer membrane protein TolC